MISKELLSEVLGINFVRFTGNNKYIMVEVADGKLTQGTNYNIHDIAHKCKEWALAKGYLVSSFVLNENDYNSNFGVCNVKSKENVTQKIHLNDRIGDTEPEAIFKACEWILNQGKQDGKM